MLPLKARERIKDAFPREYTAAVPAGFFPDAPDVTEFTQPTQVRWEYEGESPDPPYTMLSLRFSTTGEADEIQTIGPGDRVPAPDDADAHEAEIQSFNAHDELTFKVTSQGNQTLGGATLTPRERADVVTNGAYDWITQEFQDHPLDPFDDEGMAVDDSDRVYGDDLSPPVRVDRVRGPQDVTANVGADGAQWDAAVELHYREEWLRYLYTATEFPVTIDSNTSTDPG